MGQADFYVSGDNNAICDTCGRKRKASTLRKTWDGWYVCSEHWEPRHPQDYVRNVPESTPVAINRPATEPTFTAEAQSLQLPPNP
jgi:hypothetical protein